MLYFPQCRLSGSFQPATYNSQRMKPTENNTGFSCSSLPQFRPYSRLSSVMGIESLSEHLRLNANKHEHVVLSCLLCVLFVCMLSHVDLCILDLFLIGYLFYCLSFDDAPPKLFV